MTADQMPRCRDCRWWKSLRDTSGMGKCTMLGTFETTIPVRIHMANGNGRAFIVGELFGCVKFGPKEPPS